MTDEQMVEHVFDAVISSGRQIGLNVETEDGSAALLGIVTSIFARLENDALKYADAEVLHSCTDEAIRNFRVSYAMKAEELK